MQRGMVTALTLTISHLWLLGSEPGLKKLGYNGYVLSGGGGGGILLYIAVHNDVRKRQAMFDFCLLGHGSCFV